MDQKTLLQHKKRYGRVFRITLEGQEVYYRPLTIQEISHLTDRDNSESLIVELGVINDVKLKLPGSVLTLAKYIHECSTLGDEDDIEEKALENRRKIRDSFPLSLIANICAVYPYTPDQLMDKTQDQLMEIISLIEFASKKNLIGEKQTNMKMPKERTNNEDKFQEPNTQELMNESTDALSEVMEKEGKKIKKFRKKQKDNLSPLHQQMQELNNI